MRYQTDHRDEPGFAPVGGEPPRRTDDRYAGTEDVLATDDRTTGPAATEDTREPGAPPQPYESGESRPEDLPPEAISERAMPDTTAKDILPESAATGSLAAVWPADTAQGFRERWREVQLRFVDDPQAAAGDAQELVAEVLEAFSEALQTRKTELDAWGGTEGADTEQMRVAIRRYRDLMDQVLGL